MNVFIVCLFLFVALLFRPWLLLKNHSLISPFLACLVIVPFMWALPWLYKMPLQLQLSCACLVGLVLGWPLAVLVLSASAAIAGFLANIGFEQQLSLAIWLGLVPVTFSFLLGMAIRRWVWKNLFVYILGRAFLGTAVCMFAASILAQWAGYAVNIGIDSNLALVARWLMAWGDAFLTGMFAAIFVAFKPHWLATWSDAIYAAPPTQP